MDELQEHRARIAQLEAHAARMQEEKEFYRKGKNTFRGLSIFCAFTILWMVGMSILGFRAGDVRETIKARRIEIVDMTGATRGVLEPSGMAWTQAHSKHAVSLAPISGLYVMDYDGDTITHVGGVVGGLLQLRSAANGSQIYLSAGQVEDMGGTLVVSDQHGKDVVQLPPEQPSN